MASSGGVRVRAGARRLSRRRTLVGSAGGLAAGFILACGGDDPADNGTGTAGESGTASVQATQTAQEQPVSGGVISQRISADPSPLDPHQSANYSSVWPAAPCFNQLLQFDPSKSSAGPQDILPDLATRWEQPEPLTLLFTLKPGVTFHDGGAFTSQDPRVQLEWMLDPPPAKVSPRRSALLAIDAIETPDAGTLRLRLKQPAPSLLINLASHHFALGQAKDILTNGEVSAGLIGTGPFKLTRYHRSALLELVKNPAYHVPGRPYLDGLTFFIVPDYATALDNAIARQYQLFFDPSFRLQDQQRVELGTADQMETALVPSTLRHFVLINARRRPYDDIRVRQAISLALDRDTAIKVVGERAGRRGGYMTPKGAWAISEGDLKRHEGYDKPGIEKARQLLQQAGVPTPLESSAATRADLQTFGEFVVDQLGKIGINVNLNLIEGAKAQAALQRGDFDIAPWLLATNLDEPDAAFGEIATTRAARTWSIASDPSIDALYEKQSQTLNVDDRRKLVQDLERQALSQYGIAVIFFEDSRFARHRSVQDFVWQESLYTNRRMESVWLKP